MVALALAALSCAIWAYLILGHGGFWLMRERDDRDAPPEPSAWPGVCIVVPARDEADVIDRSLSRLLSQDYPGPFTVILVDDGSSDGTAQTAKAAAARLGAEARLEVLTGAPLPQGWTGKVWAMAQGAAHSRIMAPDADYLLFTDADIDHVPDNVRRLVARAEAGELVLVSLMAKLRCDTFAETMLIPAFVYFFDMVYPFSRVNDPGRKLAAAAGGCMLIRREALARAGGVEAIRAAIIDDCAMGAIMKTEGPIWLGFTERCESIRSYGGFRGIGRMVSRSAYAQLNYSPWLLIGTLFGMALTYLIPPCLALFGAGWSRALGLAGWLLMALSFQPMLRFYRQNPLWGLGLPLIGAVYSLFTWMSAVDVWTGRGGFWKGRAQAQAGRS